MARYDPFQFSFDQNMLQDLDKLANIDKYAPIMIDEALPIVENCLKGLYGSYGIANKLKVIKARALAVGGYLGQVTFKGKTGHYYKKGGRKYPLSTGGLAVFLEFGTNAHGNFPDTPAQGIVSKAIAMTEDAVKQKMQEVFDREFEKELPW